MKSKAIACSRWRWRKTTIRSGGVAGPGMGRGGDRLDWRLLGVDEAVVVRQKRGGNFGDDFGLEKGGAVTHNSI